MKKMDKEDMMDKKKGIKQSPKEEMMDKKNPMVKVMKRMMKLKGK